MVFFRDNLIRISPLRLKRINSINLAISYHAQVFPWCKGDTLDSFLIFRLSYSSAYVGGLA